MARTRRKLKGVNIGRWHHELLNLLVGKYRDSANGSQRAQTERAIEALARSEGLVPRETAGAPPQDDPA